MNDLIPSVSSDLCSLGSLLNSEVFIIRPTISYILHLSCPCKVSNDDFSSSWLTTVLARALYCFTFNDFFILPYLDDSLLYEVLKNLRTSLIVALFITSFLLLKSRLFIVFPYCSKSSLLILSCLVLFFVLEVSSKPIKESSFWLISKCLQVISIR